MLTLAAGAAWASLGFLTTHSPVWALGAWVTAIALHYAWTERGWREVAHAIGQQTREVMADNAGIISLVLLAAWGVGIACITIASSLLTRFGGLCIGVGVPAVVAIAIAARRHKAAKDLAAETRSATEPGQEAQSAIEEAPDDTVEIPAVSGEQTPQDPRLLALWSLLDDNNGQLVSKIDQLLEQRLQANRRVYDTSLAPKLEELPTWIQEKIRGDEQLHGVIRKAWPHAIPPVLSFVGLLLLAWPLLLHATGATLGIGIAIWLIAGVAVIIWFMKHIRWALVLTDKRFVRLTGVLQLQSRAIDRSKITDFSTIRTLRGRIFGFWSFKVETAGQDQAFNHEGLLAGRREVCNYFDGHLGSGA